MEDWKFITTMVVVFAFFLEMRPLDSFLTAYFTGPEIKTPLREVSDVLMPIEIRAGVFGTFLVFLLTDFLRYKPVMILNGFIGILTYSSLIGSPSTFRLKLAMVGLSMFMCTEVTYFGYLYAKISDKEHYQIATGYAKAATLSGKCVSGVLGQIVVYLNHHDYSSLPYYSLASVTFTFVWACFFPPVKYSNYFNSTSSLTTAANENNFLKSAIHDSKIPNYSEENVSKQNTLRATEVTNPFKLIFKDFKDSYTDPSVLKWSLWHTIGMFGYIQVFLYINILYTYTANVSDDKNMLYNGLVDSLATMFAAICAYYIGKINIDWTRHGNNFLAISSLAIGLTMCLCFYCKNIIFVYLMFICYDTLVQSVFVIVISQIGKELKDQCYTLVLGFNAFVAIILSTLSSMFLVQTNISIPAQFLFYGGTYVVLGILYGCAELLKKNTSKFSRHF